MKKKKYIIAATICLLLAGGAYAYLHLVANKKAPNYRSADGISYAPPTKQDRADSEATKDVAPSTSNGSAASSQTKPTAKKSVSVNITTWYQDSDNINVNGFVSDIVEDGGTCTLRLTRDSNTVSQQRQAIANATNTSCGVTSIPLAKLAPGVWQATLSYASSTSMGTSSPIQVTVK